MPLNCKAIDGHDVCIVMDAKGYTGIEASQHKLKHKYTGGDRSNKRCLSSSVCIIKSSRKFERPSRLFQ